MATDTRPRAWFIAGLTKQLRHLHEVMPAPELTLRTSGITWRTEGFGGPFNNAQLTELGQLCVDYLSAGPASAADPAE